MNISAKKKFIERCEQLIREGEKLKETREFPPPSVIGTGSFVDRETFHKWRSNSENLIVKTTGKDSSYHKDFCNNVQRSFFRDLEVGVGILKGLIEDLKQNFLEKVQDLVIAEVFTDFLDTASYLLDNGYKDPAAFLAGTVLENGLKKIAKKNNISIQRKHGREDGIGSLNKKLSQKQIYNELKRRSIHTWKEIRDNAAHGKFNEYNKNDVKTMVEGINGFLSEHF